MKIEIVIAEDEQNVNRSLSEYIEELGPPFKLAGSVYNGLQALELIKNRKVDILLTDIRMPRMDGLVLMDHVRRHQPKTEIIVLSGHNDFQYAQKAIKFGACDYLLKPLRKEELVQAFKRIASLLYKDAGSYVSLMMQQQKWDMSLIRIESAMFDEIEIGNTVGARDAGLRFLSEIRRKADHDHVRMIGYMTDSLLALNKRLSTFDNIQTYIGPKWDALKAVLTPRFSLEELEETVLGFVMDCAGIVKNLREQTSPDVLYRCRTILEEQFTRDLPQHEMAELVGVTVSHLCRLFKKEFGVTYTEYVNQLRIAKARELLRVPGIKVMEISSRVGYRNVTYFTRMFKRYTGLSPQEYRDKRAIGE
ncbi:MAG TPA: response regulator [Paenibacillus sp.]|uniref:response regulator transcription factor n=1 Tax=Paenibacillus sp. TaxID=58172 RepID=UPI0028D84FE5|nr:response regulator [Paenibacillus sp.]HUC91908.1 response regulator [Paenibacillus sp.]